GLREVRRPSVQQHYPSAEEKSLAPPGVPRMRSYVRERPLDQADEIVDRDGAQRLIAPGPPGPELQRHARDRLLVGGLDDVDEIELTQRRPLRLDRRAELLDLA